MMENRETVSKTLAVSGAGFISFLGQGAVFREFLGVFEGGELSVGFFLAFWLLWICVGSLLAVSVPGLAKRLAPHFATLLLAYIPALALQLLLTASARGFAGVASYEIFPFGKLLLAACLASAPISLLTGMLFVVATSWMSGEGVPAAKVYAFETLGSCAGALASTLLLCFGLGDAQMTLAAGLCLTAFCMASLEMRGAALWRERIPFLSVALLCFVLLVSGCGFNLDFKIDEAAFRKVVPDGSFKGSFSTRQARYLTGEREGQFLVVAWGAVIESLPGSADSANQTLALLAELPNAKKLMVSGQNSLGLCMMLSGLGEVERIGYSSLDPEYPLKLFRMLPSRLRAKLGKTVASGLDPKRLLETEKGFDLIIINSVNMASISSIRFADREFVRSVKASLSDDGALAYSFPGAENRMGRELAGLGASIYFEVRKSFPSTVLKPGDPATVFASAGEGVLSDDPVKLMARARAVRGLSELCEPEFLADLFDSGRRLWQESIYLKFEDKVPRSLDAALGYSAKRIGLPESSWTALRFAMMALVYAVALYAIMRFLWRSGFKTKPQGAPFDSGLLVFGTASATGAVFVTLLARHQIAYGSLATFFGLLNAVFMAGAFGGLRLLERFHGHLRGWTLRLALPAGAAVIGFLAAFPYLWPGLIGVQVALAGGLCGALLGFCVCEFKAAGVDDLKASATLEFADCLGGAAGGLFAALLLLPVLGFGYGVVAGLWLAALCLPLLFVDSLDLH